MNTKATNPSIAKLLGLDPSAVSRLRSGDRNPSFDTMSRIASVFGWSAAEQTLARQTGSWAEQFECVIDSFFNSNTVSE